MPPSSQVTLSALAVTNPRISTKGHVEFELRCETNEVLAGELIARPVRWSSYRRYREFEALCESLVRKYGHAASEVKFPPKKMFNANDPDFIIERCSALDAYLTEVVASCHGCAAFGPRHAPTHLESAELRAFVHFDERFALATSLTQALQPAKELVEAKVAIPSSGLWGLLGFTTQVPAAVAAGTMSAADFKKKAPTAPQPSSSSSSSSSSITSPSSSSISSSSSSNNNNNNSSSPSSPSSAQKSSGSAASIKRLQSRSQIVSSYGQQAPVSKPVIVSAPTLAPLPTALQPNSSAPAQAPTISAPPPAASPRPPAPSTPAPPSGPPRPPAPGPSTTPSGPPRPPAPPSAPPGAGAPRPPAPPSAPTGPRPPAPPGITPPADAPDRSGMLSSISAGGFKLKKAVTIDKSGPKL